MVNSLVERATSDMLIGPDWAMNIEICDFCNRDSVQAKDVVKGLKKRICSKNPKVQLLALTLLETIVKNCGDIVHMHVAEKGVLHEMVKIVRKKPDFHVKEKILILIDTWQEVFGGPRGRYPEYYGAYQELLRMGAVFPQRSESSAPVLTPPQTQPLSSYPRNLRNPESRQGAESSAEAEFPTLSLTEIQNARGIMDVLAEMLNALDLENKEGLRQEVIVDLVEQCRTYKQRVVHLVNSTSDESLLCQGLALNDDLQRLLAKHESLVSGAPLLTVKPKPGALVPVDAPLIDPEGAKQIDGGSTSSSAAGKQSLSLVPVPATNGPSKVTANAEPLIDLLSGDDFSLPKAENSLAVVLVGEPQPTSPVTQQNALALVDMFSQNNSAQSNYSAGQAYPQTPQLLQQQHNLQSPQPSFYPNGMVTPQYEQVHSPYAQGGSPAWNGQISSQQQRQPGSPVYGAQDGSFPPPPWEAQPADNSPSSGTQYQQQMPFSPMGAPHSPSGIHPQGSQPMGNDQVTGMFNQPITGSPLPAVNYQAVHTIQMVGVYPQQIPGGGQPMGMLPQQMQFGQIGYPYPQQTYNHQMPQQLYNHQMPQRSYNNQMPGYGYGYGYGYAQQQNNQFLEQRMSGLSVRDDGVMRSSSYLTAPSYVSPGKPSKPEDKLFGDLVDLTKFKPAKTTPGRAGSM